MKIFIFLVVILIFVVVYKLWVVQKKQNTKMPVSIKHDDNKEH